MQQHHEHAVNPATLISGEAAEELGAETKLAIGLEAELEDLIACVEAGRVRNVRRSKRFQKAHLAISTGAIAGIGLWLYAGRFAMQHDALTSNVMVAMLFALVALLLTPLAALTGGLAWLVKDQSTSQETDAARKLVKMDDVRVVAPLLDSIRLNGWLQPEFVRAMVRLLPRLSDEEIRCLGAKRHAILASWVHSWDTQTHRDRFADGGAAFLLALLPVVGRISRNTFQVGTPPLHFTISVLPTVRRWAMGKGAGRNPAVQEAARACRDAIEQRLHLERTGEQLLRASAATPIARQHLLHPVQEVVQTDPQELLRPRASSEGSELAS